jgi:hypothetical protein
MTTRKSKPSIFSEIEAPEERLQLITVTAKPNGIHVSPKTGQSQPLPLTAPLSATTKRRLH